MKKCIKFLSRDSFSSHAFLDNEKIVDLTQYLLKDKDYELSNKTFFFDTDLNLDKINLPDNKTREVTRDSESVQLTYSPFGERLTRTVKTEDEQRTERFVYAGDNVLIQYIYDKEGKLLKKNSVISGLGVDEIYGVTGKYFVRDYLGNIKAIFDTEGNLLNLRRYRAFGEEIHTPDSGYGFTSREYDDIAGLYYYRSRYYDPKLGRFLQKDIYNEAGYLYSNPGVIYNPAQLNPYNYVGNNPVNYIDPYGNTVNDFKYFHKKHNKKTIKVPRIWKIPFNPGGNYAVTIGNTIIVGPLWEQQSDLVKISIISHEFTHTQQEENLVKESINSWFTGDPLQTEIEAYTDQEDLVEAMIEDPENTNEEKEDLYLHLKYDIEPNLEDLGIEYNIPEKYEKYNPSKSKKGCK